MKATQFFKFLISPTSGYSSKRFAALILLFFGILVPIVCMFLPPLGEVHDSILLLALQLLASGCGLLGFTLKDKPVIGRPQVILPEESIEDEVIEDIPPKVEKSEDLCEECKRGYCKN